jgi:hypothetical protein
LPVAPAWLGRHLNHGPLRRARTLKEDPNLDSIRFDTAGLELHHERDRERIWSTEAGEPVRLYFFHRPPDLPAPLNDRRRLAGGFRDMAVRAGLGLVEVNVVETHACLGVSVIVKGVLDRATGWGRTYAGSLIIPFRDFSFVVKTQFQEVGTPGVRETVIIDRLLASGAIHPRTALSTPPAQARVLGPGDLQGWLLDQSDPTPPHLAPNVSEDRSYDVEFPNHPLSRVRAFLDRLVRSLELAPEVKTAPRFNGPARVTRWWHFWS